MTIEESGNEIMAILQEECAEVIQAVSKINRFGFESVHAGISNREHLEEEVGDLMCMIDLMIDSGILREGSVMAAKHEKLLKLQQWSKIFA